MKTNRMRKVIVLCLTLLLFLGIAVPAPETVSAAPSLSGYHLSSAEKKAFTKILKGEAGKKRITYKNSDDKIIWAGNGVKFKKGYTGFTGYCIKKMNGKNVLCLYGEVPEGGTIDNVLRMYYLVNGKLKSYNDAGTRMWLDGYSSKASGLVISCHIGNCPGNYILTYKNGKIVETKMIRSIIDDSDSYLLIGKKEQPISKSQYDKIYNTYYAEGQYKEIKWKSIRAFR